MNKRHRKSNAKRKRAVKPCFISLCFDIPISKDEALRIGECINNDDDYKAIVYEYCHHTPAFKEVEKKWPIRGFRAGSKGSLNGVSNRLADTFRESNHKNYAIQCRLYRQGVIAYFKVIKPSLFALLDQKTNIQDLQKATEHLIETAIIEKIDLNDIEHFFALFGISQNPTLTHTLEKAKDSDPELVVDMVRTLSHRVDELSNGKRGANTGDGLIPKKLSSIQADIQNLFAKVASLENSKPIPETPTSSEQNPISHVEEGLMSLRETSSSLQKDLIATQQLINNVGERCEALIQEQALEQDKQLSSFRLQLEQLNHHVRLQSEHLEDMDSKYAALTKAIKELPAAKAIAERLPSSIRKLRLPKKAANITKEQPFAAYYSLRLSQKHNIHLDRTQALIYHTLFLESPVILLDDYALFDAWVETLGWKSNVLSYTATPTWISGEDWEQGSQALLDKSDTPRFVVIHNFDLALVQSYLLPILHQRFLQTDVLHSPATLVLIPSEIQIQSEYPDVLQYGTGIEANDFARLDRQERHLRSYIEEIKLGLHRTDETFVSSDTINQWINSTQESPEEIQEILRAAQMEIPLCQKQLVSHLYRAMQRCLDNEEALLASLYHSTKLWCRAKYDEPMAERFYELATMMTSGQVTY